MTKQIAIIMIAIGLFVAGVGLVYFSHYNSILTGN